ncbi:hypothetical protein KP509_21G087300 [Ceratopteris richardii]|nr:hypothetical protein KP509_21G087300 [Ceratopteris richardii]
MSSSAEQRCGNGDPRVEVSCDSPLFGRRDGAEEPVAMRQDENDAESDCNSWVEVKKQRVLIIIPPVPETTLERPMGKPMSSQKGIARYTSAKSRRVACGDSTISDKLLSIKVYNRRKNKKTWMDAVRTLETRGEAIEGNATGKTNKGDPVSGMDILLASALGSDNTSWQGVKHHPNGSDPPADEVVSLDTADSSIQPTNSSHKGDRLRAIELRSRSEHSDKGRNHAAVIHTTCPSSGLREPDCMIRKAIPDDDDDGGGGGDCDSGVLSPSEAIRALNLEKHLKNAGGFERWLCSLGLGQFREVFDKRTWSERDLLELQMDDLKHMGKPAVGPRRKLIWAIHHLSQQLV